MQAWWVDGQGTSAVALDQITEALRRDDGLLWLDIAEWSDPARELLASAFGFHPLALSQCAERNHIPRIHAYPDHLFVVLHAPQIGQGGHVHYLELDQFIGPNYLVTVHGPLNPLVDPRLALTETDAVRARVAAGRLHPASAYALSYAIVSSIIRKQENMVADLARQVGLLEQKVMASANEEPQRFLTELFTIRHELMTVRTMSSQGMEIFRRAIHLADFAPAEGRAAMKDQVDQYQRVSQISGSQLEFLAGVTEFYRARTDTKMTIAAERLAVIAAVTLPITAVSSVMGMNVIVNDSTHWGLLIVILIIMLAMSLLLLRWTKKQAWW